MAEDKEPKDTKPKALKKEDIIKSQAEYTGNSQHDTVKVTIVKDSDFYKEGDTDVVHPTTAAIMKAKGIIGDYEDDVKTYKAPKPEDFK